MTRVDELQKKYPNLAREIIVKWEVLRNGIRDSETLDKVSDWIRSTGAYQSRDIDVTLKGMAEKRPQTVRPGYILRARYLYMRNGIGARMFRSTSSPYQIRERAEGKYALYEGEDKVENVYFPGHERWANEVYTSKGTPVTSLISMERTCFSFGATRYCEYFARGEQCKFCNFNATQDDARAIGTDVQINVSSDDTVEAYKIIGSTVNIVEGRFEMGGFRDRKNEAKLHINFLAKLIGATSYTPHITVYTQPMRRKDMQRVKDIGAAAMGFQMEVWDPALFAEICPGKDKYDGFERYKEAFQEAVDIFGVGHVKCGFVGGVSVIPANGHKTWQESRDALVEGCRWMIRNGVFPSFHALRLGAGSTYGDDPSNRAKLPPTDYYLDTAIGHHQAMMDCGLYGRLDRLLQCPLDCHAPYYAGEIGVLAIAGNLANWTVEAVPAKANWLSGFVESSYSGVRESGK